MPNVAFKINTENIIKTIVNMSMTALVLLKNKGRFFSTLATGSLFGNL